MTEPTTSLPEDVLHLTLIELEAGLHHIRQSPPDHGALTAIVIRPEKEQRLVLEECELSPQLGVHGDRWASGGAAPADRQVTLMNARAIALFARTPERQALAGDQLYVDLDLSDDNLQPGQRLAVGSAILEITSPLHKGCAKFEQRYGSETLRFVNSPRGLRLHLRGLNARVIQAGQARVGDRISKC